MKRILAILLLVSTLVPCTVLAIPPSPPSSGSVTSTSVVAAFGSGSCSGYLKSDGTCDTPTPAAGTIAASFQSGSGAITVTAGKYSTFVTCTDACSITPIAPAAGVQLCVRNAPGVVTAITLVNMGAGKYYELTDHSAYATANQKLVSGGAATDQICIVGLDATHYLTMSSTGTWTDTAP